MTRYRKKPVVVDAWQFTMAGLATVPRWVVATLDLVEGHNVLLIETLEGMMTAQVNDYIIRGVKGELYPCKPDIFEATYEQAEA
jgi:hypothetical protein